MPRSTILYPTLVAEAVDQIVLLKDPIFGHKRAEIALRPVKGRGPMPDAAQLRELAARIRGSRLWAPDRFAARN